MHCASRHNISSCHYRQRASWFLEILCTTCSTKETAELAATHNMWIAAPALPSDSGSIDKVFTHEVFTREGEEQAYIKSGETAGK